LRYTHDAWSLGKGCFSVLSKVKNADWFLFRINTGFSSLYSHLKVIAAFDQVPVFRIYHILFLSSADYLAG
jgi:hypothetical protein